MVECIVFSLMKEMNYLAVVIYIFKNFRSLEMASGLCLTQYLSQAQLLKASLTDQHFEEHDLLQCNNGCMYIACMLCLSDDSWWSFIQLHWTGQMWLELVLTLLMCLPWNLRKWSVFHNVWRGWLFLRFIFLMCVDVKCLYIAGFQIDFI